jgi:hypothetical protein
LSVARVLSWLGSVRALLPDRKFFLNLQEYFSATEVAGVLPMTGRTLCNIPNLLMYKYLGLEAGRPLSCWHAGCLNNVTLEGLLYECQVLDNLWYVCGRNRSLFEATGALGSQE